MDDIVQFPGDFKPEVPLEDAGKVNIEQQFGLAVARIVEEYTPHLSKSSVVGVLTTLATLEALR